MLFSVCMTNYTMFCFIHDRSINWTDISQRIYNSRIALLQIVRATDRNVYYNQQ